MLCRSIPGCRHVDIASFYIHESMNGATTTIRDIDNLSILTSHRNIYIEGQISSIGGSNSGDISIQSICKFSIHFHSFRQGQRLRQSDGFDLPEQDILENLSRYSLVAHLEPFALPSCFLHQHRYRDS